MLHWSPNSVVCREMVAAASFAAGFVYTPLCRNLAIRRGVLDRPDHNRKIYPGPIPRIGTREVLT